MEYPLVTFVLYGYFIFEDDSKYEISDKSCLIKAPGYRNLLGNWFGRYVCENNR